MTPSTTTAPQHAPWKIAGEAVWAVLIVLAWAGLILISAALH